MTDAKKKPRPGDHPDRGFDILRRSRVSEGKPLYLGYPEFEGFTTLQEVKAKDAREV